jgi:hypothetical protein
LLRQYYRSLIMAINLSLRQYTTTATEVIRFVSRNLEDLGAKIPDSAGYSFWASFYASVSGESTNWPTNFGEQARSQAGFRELTLPARQSI